MAPFPEMAQAAEYLTDAWQRSVLFMDVMRQRAAQYEAHGAEPAFNVLDYESELILDGRSLARPVNYLLYRIEPPRGVAIDSLQRPFVIVDPRAGQSPGIGGFKADSEVGVALKAGHPVYFIGFLPEPVPGQTILDITEAQAVFLEAVIARHPEAEGKPCVIGNCQAGWAVMILAALRPELFGPIIIPGTPLSYWAGVPGQYPMRYSGGLLGGTWLTALASDLGGGIFDGAALVQNFENQDPANTLWTKQYNLWSKIDTEPERYLGFEKWWNALVTLNAEEMQWIVDELFVGNHLATGDIRTADGTAIDLRGIRSPIVVFCSRGDNITPPQQALDWILDLYHSDDDIRAWGQTIVYTIHEHVGHLGIFVSGRVARKEHDEFAHNIDLIDVLPPGLYEAVLTPKDEASVNADLVTGDWVMRCEARTLDDIRALGGNELADERKFEAVARLSDINLALYRTFAQPWVRACTTPAFAEATRRLHPLRLSYEMFAPKNLWMGPVEPVAEWVRENRRPASADNPYLAMQDVTSTAIVQGLDAWRDLVGRLSEASFHAVYGNRALQAALGIDTSSSKPPRKVARTRLHAELVKRRGKALRASMSSGTPVEAVIRALLWVGMSGRVVDERHFAEITRLRRTHAESGEMTLADFKQMVHEQYLILLLDEDAALHAIPELMPESNAIRRQALDTIRDVIEASGALDAMAQRRLDRIGRLLGIGPAGLDNTPHTERRSENGPP